MIIEYFLVAILMHGTADQEILLLDRQPTLKWCQAKAQEYQEVAPDRMTFGCMGSSGPTQHTI